MLTGVANHFAVEGTAREAVDPGYRVVVLEDCAGRVKNVHDFSINVILRSLCDVTTAASFVDQLRADKVVHSSSAQQSTS